MCAGLVSQKQNILFTYVSMLCNIFEGKIKIRNPKINATKMVKSI